MKILIIANWKCNPSSLICAKKLFSDIKKGLQEKQNTEIIICPPFTYIHDLSVMAGKKIKIGAQNVFWEEGTHTGEVSAKMLKNMGCKYAIIGHSERREYFKETHDMLKLKVNKALENSMDIIFCFGEELKDRKSENHFSVISNQISESLFHLKKSDWTNIVLAYEPVWAIGTGETASSYQVQEMHNFIRTFVAKKYNTQLAESVSILYGGSVKPGNAKEIFSMQDVDGGLIGGAALNSKDFFSIVNSF
jgi:triosephosphate isomerase